MSRHVPNTCTGQGATSRVFLFLDSSCVQRTALESVRDLLLALIVAPARIKTMAHAAMSRVSRAPHITRVALLESVCVGLGGRG